MTTEEKGIMTMTEVARLLRVSVRTVRRLIASGQLRAFGGPRTTRVRRSALLAYADRTERGRDVEGRNGPQGAKRSTV